MTSARKVLIAGGGTAGWLTAAYLARVLGHGKLTCPQITLIESPDIGTIGVGEGSFATIRTTLQTLGLDEETFLREATATFKQGIRFADWEKKDSWYFHPFDPPYPVEGAGLLPYWLLQDEAARLPFAQAVALQKKVAETQRAPKRLFENRFGGALNYAYHFDAGKFAKLLSRHAVSMGVTHLQGRINDVKLAQDGSIAGVVTADHGELNADLYIDCTGFAAVLIGKALGSPYKSVRKHLLTDRAIACQVPYPRPDAPIESYTVSTGHEAGWTWDIGLDVRRGVGYVYSSDHSSDERAEEVLRTYVGPTATDFSTRVIKFDTGYREQQWIKNCVAIGLSGGFFEPLEATGIMLIEVAIGMLTEYFPHAGPIDANAAVFNRLMTLRNEKLVNFLKLHYCVSKRHEPFWRENCDPATIPEELNELLDMWKYRMPSRFDVLDDIDTFAFFNYQYILYGMGFSTDLSAQRDSHPKVAEAKAIFDKIALIGDQAARDLPTHRALIDQVYSYGYAEPPAQRFMSVKR
ncbi:FAD dependent oxidoreductase family protein [Asticcacaulis biprosthecium C19]|uniref:FAD dependent oxidoreductase family protein n=1 Tax=Asticcacaulis biprosthecium C19 TaxID=715226 RepID=F4QLY4_9CAUL|nr:tryptophan halogenase family protein [Asticcacaulis biprosthecium]EGF93556.1 FAD dependent oxidoreductase family protein [Asticcacaulis biprosthecium C19]